MEKFALANNLIQKDTIIIRDTVITNRVEKDTVFHYQEFYKELHDTVVLQQEKLRVQIHRVRDSVFIYGECAADTVINEVLVPINRVVIKKESWYKRFFSFAWFWILIIASVFLIKTYWNK